MGMRAQKTVPAYVPMDVQLAIAKDPTAFERKLIEWDERRAAAEEAEGRAKRARDDAEVTERASAAAALERSKRIDADNAKAAAALAQAVQARAEVEARLREAVAKDQDIAARRAALDARAGELKREDEALAARREQVERLAAVTQATAEKLDAREKALIERENRFASRIKALNEGL